MGATSKQRSRRYLKGSFGSLLFGLPLIIPNFINFHILVDQHAHQAEIPVFDPPAKTPSLMTSDERSIPSQNTKKNHRLDPDTIFPRDDPFCLTWTINADDWWTRHPAWEQGMENDTHYCFAPMPKPKARFFRKIYKNQFLNANTNCSNVVTQEMWQAGWGADFMHVADALWYGFQNHRPVQVSDHSPWHYAAATKHGNQTACPLKSMYCYFLNMTNCQPRNDDSFSGVDGRDFFQEKHHPDPAHPVVNRLIEYATRPQVWLRKEVYEFTKRISLEAPCSVLHVRRADVVLHDKWSRRYRDLEEYMNASSFSDQQRSPLLEKTILLLTDDANAIQEAHDKYPEYRWVHIDRPRFKGPEGGFENQFPSSDPKQEVIVLLSIFQLVRRCRSFVHTKSNLGYYIAGIMQLNNAVPNQHVTVVNLDENLSLQEIHSMKHYIRYVPGQNISR